MIDFENIHAPRRDGDILVLPSYQELPDLARLNRRRLDSATIAVMKDGLPDVRRWTRTRLGWPVDTPLIATGHQPEWIHAGIWAKHVVADDLARRLDTPRAANLVVDHDVVRNITLGVPRRTTDGWTVEPCLRVPFNRGMRFEQVPAISDRTLEIARSTVDELLSAAGAPSLMDVFFRAAQGSASTGWVDQMTRGRRAVDHRFGIDLVEWRCEQWPLAPFVGWIMNDARRFAREHNAVLADYRARRHIRGRGRPIADLRLEDDGVELPFWAIRSDGPRARPFLVRRGPRMSLRDEHGAVICSGFDPPNDISSSLALEASLLPWRLVPRAITLTLWARLFLADLFIHGVGGARYDVITDELIRRWIGFSPPAYACVSATLLLKWDFGTNADEQIPPGGSWARFARFHPERFLDRTDDLLTWFDERAKAIRRCDDLRETRPRDRASRRAGFEELRALTRKLLSERPEILSLAMERDRQTSAQRCVLALARDRTYFVALHAPGKLQALCEKLTTAADSM